MTLLFCFIQTISMLKNCSFSAKISRWKIKLPSHFTFFHSAFFHMIETSIFDTLLEETALILLYLIPHLIKWVLVSLSSRFNCQSNGSLQTSFPSQHVFILAFSCSYESVCMSVGCCLKDYPQAVEPSKQKCVYTAHWLQMEQQCWSVIMSGEAAAGAF